MPSLSNLDSAISRVTCEQESSGKALGIIVAGHNGSGKSTMWNERLAGSLKIPLINADRMMLSILPEPRPPSGRIPGWASELRDTNETWMRVAQKSVQGFVANAMARKVAFAKETVFSHWVEHSDGRIDSKICEIRDLQISGYYVVLLFVGLTNVNLSIGRVATRVLQGGHAVDTGKLVARFPRTQKAIGKASLVADANIMMDNSRTEKEAFTVCRVQLRNEVFYDIRKSRRKTPVEIQSWLDTVAPCY